MAHPGLTPPAGGARSVVAIGECMVELSDRPDGARLGFGGDTLNTALYLARLGMSVEYVTALGDDPYSEEMLASWREEGVATRFVTRVAGRLPGLYAIRTDAAGERRFYYWRMQAPARELLRGPGRERVDEALAGAGLVYLSGITVSILDEPQREALMELLTAARGRGAWIAFDANYRPAGWPDAATARHWMDGFHRIATHALPSLDDECALWPETDDAAAAATRLAGLGVSEIVVKSGRGGCWIWEGGDLTHIPAEPVKSVDSTAAGDSFNAAYLAARMANEPPHAAARQGHALAAAVVGHPGAIIPREAMPGLARAATRKP